MAESNGRGEFIKALIAAKKGFKPLKKDKVNPFFKSKYADLAGLHEAIDESLEKNGFIVTQPFAMEGERYLLRTTVEHISGHKLESVYTLPGGVKPQEFAAAVTYGRRVSLASLLAIPAEDDDDGNGANEAHEPPKKTHHLPPRPEAPKPSEPSIDPVGAGVAGILYISLTAKVNDSWWKIIDAEGNKYACTKAQADIADKAVAAKLPCRAEWHVAPNKSNVIDSIEVAR